MNYMDRKIALKALVGSHNYNLNTGEMVNNYTGEKIPASDKDYKVFILPTFDDLYEGKMFAKQTIDDKEDHDVHDVRKLSNLFYKANVNFLEILFSNEVYTPVEDDSDMVISRLIAKIGDKKNEIAKMNLPHLFNACGGMHLNKMKLLYKGTEGTQHLVDMFGYDTKQALHAYRILNFIDRFEQTGFNDFKSAMTYTGQDRDFMLDIKHGFFKPDTYENFVNFYHETKFQTLKEKYHSFEPNEELRVEIEDIIKQAVKEGLKDRLT